MKSAAAFADLRILATSDVHMHLTGWDVLHERHVAGRGFDLLASTIARLRSTAPGACLLVDNGDSLEGAPVGAICAAHSTDLPHPWAAILNEMAYDAVGLGNHDFDFGAPFLQRVLGQIDAPGLCASFSSGGMKGVVPTVMLRRTVRCSDQQERSIKIGLTSVLPPQTAKWNHRYLTGLMEFAPGVVAARRAVAALQAEGADIIVMLCHSGLENCPAGDDENFGRRIAKEVEGIDALILGHTHQRFPGPDGKTDLNGVPAVMPGYGAEVVGKIDLTLGWRDNSWHVARHDVALHAPSEADIPMPAIRALSAPAVQATKTALGQTLAKNATGFHTYFGMLQSSPAEAMTAQTMMDVIADHVAGTELAKLPLIAAAAPYAMGGVAGPGHYVNVPKGPLQVRHIAMMAPFPNAIWALVLRGHDLIRWLERSAAFFAPDLEEGGVLVNPDAPCFNFDMLHGLQAEIDPFGPPMFDPIGRVINPNARRVRRLSHAGSPVDEDAEFLVAMSSFRGAGGGDFPCITDSTQVVRTNHDLADALQRAAVAGRMVPGDAPPVWRFASDRAARVSVETSPEARAHLHQIAHFDPRVIGETDAGFLELSVQL